MKKGVHHQRRQVALVVHDFSPGFGQGTYCVELARRLAASHDVHVFANHFGVPCEPYWTYQKVPAWRRSAMLTILSFLAQVRGRLARRRFDIVHSQGVACWSADVITAHVCNATRLEQDTLRSPRERLFDTLAGQLEMEFYRHNHAARWIAVSGQIAREFQDLHEPARLMPVIYHGVDTAQFRPLQVPAQKRALREALGLRAERWLWLFVGEASKGLMPALHALREFPDADLLVISRSAPAPWLSRAADLGILTRVLWPGPQTAPAPFYQAADAFVYPSPYDAFGMVVAEAMSTGLPVVVNDGIGAAEWIRHGDNGLVGNIVEPAALTSLLRVLAALPDRGAQLGANARLTARHFSWDRCAEATLQVYEQVWNPASP